MNQPGKIKTEVWKRLSQRNCIRARRRGTLIGLVALTFTFLSGCKARNQSKAQVRDEKTALPVPEAEAQTTFDDLLKQIDPASGKKTIEAVLDGLSERYRSHYALIHTSRTKLQDASYGFPRVIMFGEDAKLILAFNGSPRQKGYFSLEVIRFEEEKNEFEFYTVAFDPLAYKDPAMAKSPKLSGKNPAVCFACHTGRVDGGSLRPNWDNYWHWEGAYGEFDDHVHPAGSIYKGQPIPRTIDNRAYRNSETEKLTAEENGLKSFLAGPAAAGRYKRLVDLESRYTELAPEYDEFRLKANPNQVFGRRLFFLNARRIVQELLIKYRVPKHLLAWITTQERGMHNSNKAKFIDEPNPTIERWPAFERFDSEMADRFFKKHPDFRLPASAKGGDAWSQWRYSSLGPANGFPYYLARLGIVVPYEELIPNWSMVFSLESEAQFAKKVNLINGFSVSLMRNGNESVDDLYGIGLCSLGDKELDVWCMDTEYRGMSYRIARGGYMKLGDAMAAFEKYVRPELVKLGREDLIKVDDPLKK